MNIATALKTSALTLLLASCGPSENLKTNFQSNSNSQSGIREGLDAQGGDEIAIGTVGIISFNKTGGGGYCSGSLLAKNLVLTAAHCIDPSMTTYIVFSTDTNIDPTDLKKVARLVDDYILHPEYNDDFRIPSKDPKAQPRSSNDIAVLHYEGSTPSNYRPVKLLKDYRQLREGTVVTVAGYGIAFDEDAIADAKKPRTSKEIAEQPDTSGVGKLRSAEVTLMGSLNPTEMVFDQSKGSGACQGDSGGPAYLRNKNSLQVFGVASRGAPRTEGSPCMKIILYTAVGPYFKFIKDSAKNLITKAATKDKVAQR